MESLTAEALQTGTSEMEMLKIPARTGAVYCLYGRRNDRQTFLKGRSLLDKEKQTCPQKRETVYSKYGLGEPHFIGDEAKLD